MIEVKLSPLTMNHFQYLLPISIANPTLVQYSPSPFGSENLLKELFEINLKKRENQTQYPFVIFDKKEQKYAGSTSFLAISNHNKRIEIGSTWIGPDFQRTGLNRNCKFLLFRYAFENFSF